jgi:DNA polymerase III epsilon subunit family exonuclease
MTEGRGSSRQFVALDLETTGLSAETDRIVEIGAVRFLSTGQEVSRYQRLVNPERRMSPGAYTVHGISDADVADEAPARVVLPEFLDFLGDPLDTVLLAHNASFDTGFLGWVLGRAGLPLAGYSVFDTLSLARRKLPMLSSHRLDAVARHLGLEVEGAHRALADSLCVKDVWLRLGGHAESPESVVSYRLFDPGDSVSVPEGWESLQVAIVRGCTIRIEYDGGTRGQAPRSIIPRRFVRRGGSTCLLAFCVLDCFEKAFRLDRIRVLEPTPEDRTDPVHVDRPAAGG